MGEFGQMMVAGLDPRKYARRGWRGQVLQQVQSFLALKDYVYILLLYAAFILKRVEGERERYRASRIAVGWRGIASFFCAQNPGNYLGGRG